MDTAWADRQRRRFTIYIVMLGISLLAIYLMIVLYRPSTCFDGKQNQDERGIDCGGDTCSLLCGFQNHALNLMWARPFEVSKGWWSALAYLENPNTDAYAEHIKYRFQFYDKDGGLIAEKVDSTYMDGSPTIAVFAGRVDTGERVPYRVTFELLTEPVWHRYTKLYNVSLEEQEITTGTFGQDLDVVVNNQEPVQIKNMRVVAIAYDGDHNAFAASETLIDQLAPNSKREITFSWPKQLSQKPARIELVPRIPRQE